MQAKAVVFGLVLLLLAFLLSVAGGVEAQPALHVPHMTAQEGSTTVVINEVLPNPQADGDEWVELYHPSTLVYLPLITRDGGAQSAGAVKHSTGMRATVAGNTIDISGWQVTDEDGNAYTIPDALPPVPPNGYVLIYFDGQGPSADDYDFSDGVAVLHATMTDVLEDDFDQVALYDGSDIVDFVAYGDAAGDDDVAPVIAGIWTDERYVGATEQIPGGNVLVPGGSVGLYPGDDTNTFDDWAIYGPTETSPGAPNPAPAPYFRTPPDGIRTTDHRVPFGWSSVTDAVSYQFQVATTTGFEAPVIDEDVDTASFIPSEDLADGTYYYRVRARRSDGSYSAYSAVGEVTIFTVAAAHETTEVQASVLLGVTAQLQHKDSRMLCVDGHNRTGQNRWDSAHEDDGDWIVGNGTALRSNAHDNMYCTRASISMIVDYHGGSLSQDRISYYKYDGGPPEGDLGHGQGLWPDELCTWGSGTAGDDDVFTWAMDGGAIDCARGKPTFNQVRNWIDDGRPILIVENGDTHSVVLDGYNTTGNLAHRVDPWTGTGSWVDYASWNITEYHAPEVNTPRSDEANFAADSDGDGVTDFDETNRFGTSPNTPDFDEDWVNDKWDIFDVYFNAAGNNAPKAAGADMDGDGLRKEVDADNDGGGTVDGCEDADYDGRLDGGETNNFSAGDDVACVPAFDIRSPLQAVPGEVGDKSSPDKLMVRVLAGIPPAAGTLTLSTADFDVEIGGDTASIVVPPYRVGDEYWLIVQPPAKASADYYDLDVTLQGTQSDSETDAVHYSDTPRAPVDEVLIVDNSGSMADYSKMVSAKNAARAFVDRWKTDDMVGVVAFSTTVSVPFPLTTVTDTITLDTARTAINAMPDSPPATWLTAIGSGLLTGKTQLAGGGATHEQSIVLLSDGMENVAPKWSDPGSGVQTAFTGCDITVHTVAMGPSNASWRPLLEDISNGACNGDGEAWHTSGGDTSPTTAGVQATAFPTSLSNRLADIYLSIAEQDARDQRLWEATGSVDREAPALYDVYVPDGLPEAIWTLNWDVGALELRLFDPDGNLVKDGDPGVTRLQDATHDQFRIATPQRGIWRVELHHVGKEAPSEYLAVLSGHSNVNMWLLFGLIPRDRVIEMRMPINVALADHDPIAGAMVTATIKAPNEEFSQVLPLYDDGGHEDGKADDGLYGNVYDLDYAGSYTVKAVATGKDNQGEPFERYLTRSFYVLPRLAYIYDAQDPTGVATAYSYQRLLEANGFAVDLLPLDSIDGDTQYWMYEVVIIGPETGYLDTWGTPGAVNALSQAYRPIIGLGEGGYAFFGQLDLDVGHPNGAHGSETDVYAVDPSSAVWNDPYPIDIPRDRIVSVYTDTAEVGIYVPKAPADVTLIGRERGSQSHYSIVEQAPHYLLWGFGASPDAMTAIGRELFVNVVWYAE